MPWPTTRECCKMLLDSSERLFGRHRAGGLSSVDTLLRVVARCCRIIRLRNKQRTATKIQAAARTLLARRQLMVVRRAASKVAAYTRRHAAIVERARLLHERSATRVQAAFRSYKSHAARCLCIRRGPGSSPGAARSGRAPPWLHQDSPRPGRKRGRAPPRQSSCRGRARAGEAGRACGRSAHFLRVLRR